MVMEAISLRQNYKLRCTMNRKLMMIAVFCVVNFIFAMEERIAHEQAGKIAIRKENQKTTQNMKDTGKIVSSNEESGLELRVGIVRGNGSKQPRAKL